MWSAEKRHICGLSQTVAVNVHLKTRDTRYEICHGCCMRLSLSLLRLSPCMCNTMCAGTARRGAEVAGFRYYPSSDERPFAYGHKWNVRPFACRRRLCLPSLCSARAGACAHVFSSQPLRLSGVLRDWLRVITRWRRLCMRHGPPEDSLRASTTARRSRC